MDTSGRRLERSTAAKKRPAPIIVPRFLKKKKWASRKPSLLEHLEDPKRTKPLVGLEYVVELWNADSNKLLLSCKMCDVQGETTTIMAHLYGFKHTKAYLSLHHYSVLHNFQSQTSDKWKLAAMMRKFAETLERKESPIFKVIHLEDGNVRTEFDTFHVNEKGPVEKQQEEFERQAALTFSEKFKISSNEEATLLYGITGILSKRLEEYFWTSNRRFVKEKLEWKGASHTYEDCGRNSTPKYNVYKDSGKRSPSRDSSKRSPFRNSSKRLSSSDSGKSSSSSDSGKSSSSSDSGKSSTSSDSGEHSSYRDSGKHSYRDSGKGSSCRDSGKGSSRRDSGKGSSRRDSDKGSSYRDSGKGSSYGDSGKGSSYRDSGKSSSYRDSGKSSSYRDSGKSSSYRDSGKSSSYKDSVKDSSYRDSVKDSSYRDSGKDSSYRDSGKDSSYRDSGKDSTHRDSGKDSTHRDSGKDSTHRDSGKDSTCTGLQGKKRKYDETDETPIMPLPSPPYNTNTQKLFESEPVETISHLPYFTEPYNNSSSASSSFYGVPHQGQNAQYYSSVYTYNPYVNTQFLHVPQNPAIPSNTVTSPVGQLPAMSTDVAAPVTYAHTIPIEEVPFIGSASETQASPHDETDTDEQEPAPSTSSNEPFSETVSASYSSGKTSKTLTPDVINLLKGKDVDTVIKILKTIAPFYPALQDVNIDMFAQESVIRRSPERFAAGENYIEAQRAASSPPQLTTDCNV